MNHIEYTKAIIEKHTKPDGIVLLVGAGFNPKSVHMDMSNVKKENIIVNEPGKDLAEWCDTYKNSDEFRPVDLAVLCRVLEHLPVRKVDWYLYQLYTVMAEGSQLICTVPDMQIVVNQLRSEFGKDGLIDYFKVARLMVELFNEGPHVWDRHALWTSEDSVRYYLEVEGLFMVESVERVSLDTNLVPDYLQVIALRL